ncbi:hypothetical protein ACLOJK_036236 [Asimina triloba]
MFCKILNVRKFEGLLPSGPPRSANGFEIAYRPPLKLWSRAFAAYSRPHTKLLESGRLSFFFIQDTDFCVKKSSLRP